MARQLTGHGQDTRVRQTASMAIKTLGSELQRARKAKKLRQDDVARELKCDRHQVSDWERGRTQPDAAERKTLANFLGVSRSLLDSLYIPPLPRVGRTPEIFCSHKVRFLPTGDKPPWKRMLALFKTSLQIYQSIWHALNKREDRDCIRRHVTKAQLDSKHEGLGWMRLILHGLVCGWLSPLRCGFRDLPIIDPDSYMVVGDCRFPCLLREGEYPAVIFIQNTLLTRNGGPLRPDGLVGVKFNGAMHWCVSEFDGEGYEGAENERAVHFGMPVVRFSVKEIWDPGFAELYWKRIHAALGLPE